MFKTTTDRQRAFARLVILCAEDRLHLVRQLGLPPGRIRAVVGAQTDGLSHAELWLVPPAARKEGAHLDSR